MTPTPDLPLPGLPPPWSHVATRRWLAANSLPADFQREDRYGKKRPVQPSHAQDYGKWLAETPYFPGLFEEIHEILSLETRLDPEDKSPAWDVSTGAVWLVEKLAERERMRGVQAKLI